MSSIVPRTLYPKGRLLCPVCRKEHHNGKPKPNITLIVHCGPCERLAKQMAESLDLDTIQSYIERRFDNEAEV
jgi:hypothetical protein